VRRHGFRFKSEWAKCLVGGRAAEKFLKAQFSAGSIRIISITIWVSRPFCHFGLCALDIAKIKRETKGRAHVSPPLKAGASHVRIENCEVEEVQQALARIATVLQPPTR
jgi:hypothetical protein